MVFVVFITKLWLIFGGLVIFIELFSIYYNRPTRGISINPDLRPFNKHIQRALMVCLYLCLLFSAILIGMSLIDYLVRPEKIYIDKRSVEYFIDTSNF